MQNRNYVEEIEIPTAEVLPKDIYLPAIHDEIYKKPQDTYYTENPKYFKILSNEFPDFLYDYINTPEIQKQARISITSGTIYSKLYNQMWYSNLDHSVALIIWNFTKEKKQTLAGLFHDISTPVFKHTIDFLNKDYEKQESTQELTTKIITESKKIMNLLKRDGIKVEEVSDYRIYPNFYTLHILHISM